MRPLQQLQSCAHFRSEVTARLKSCIHICKSAGALKSCCLLTNAATTSKNPYIASCALSCLMCGAPLSFYSHDPEMEAQGASFGLQVPEQKVPAMLTCQTLGRDTGMRRMPALQRRPSFSPQGVQLEVV